MSILIFKGVGFCITKVECIALGATMKS